MINTNRIVPITAIDYLSMIGTILALAGTKATALQPVDVEGSFVVDADDTYLASQPVKALAFGENAAAATVYFCADYHFEGITLAGAPVDISAIKPDGITLYTAELEDGEVTIAALTPSAE